VRGGLSRREFLARTAVVAALTGIDASVLGPTIAEARRQAPADAPSTLHQTILQRPTTNERCSPAAPSLWSRGSSR
jgi:hypothetical protein